LTSTADLPIRLVAVKQRLTAENRSSEKDSIGAVVAVILFEEEEAGISTLLIQRAKRTGDPWSGQIGLPGGRIKESDNSPRQALKREAVEEVGIDLDASAVELGPLSLGFPMRRTELRVQPWVYGVREKPGTTIGLEVDEAFWVPLTSLTSNSTTAHVPIRGEKIDVEAFVVNGKIVWGFTHRVLSELLQIPELMT
jgi:8-oxo-dGTP pyrophosphatase MutT (NUDIX family)